MTSLEVHDIGAHFLRRILVLSILSLYFDGAREFCYCSHNGRECSVAAMSDT